MPSWDEAFESFEEKSTAAPEPEVKAAETAPAPEPEVKAAESAPAPEPEAKAVDGGRDEKGRFVGKAKAETPPPDETPAEEVSAEPETEEPEEEAPAPVASKYKPPASWRPDAREEFAKAPASVQREVLRREREIGTLTQQLGEANQAKQVVQTLRETLTPYQPLLRAANVQPLQAVQESLQFAYNMQQNPAETLARLIVSKQVPVEALAQALDRLEKSGGAAQAPAAPPQAQPDIDTLVQSALSKHLGSMQESRLKQEAEEFAATHEFVDEELQEDMASFISVMRRHNPGATTKQLLDAAYEKAKALRPDIQAVETQRKAAADTKAKAAAATKAKAAASSLKSQPAASPVSGPKHGTSWDDAFAHAEKVLSGRT